MRQVLRLRPLSLFVLSAFWTLHLLWAEDWLTDVSELRGLGKPAIGLGRCCEAGQALQIELPSFLCSPGSTWCFGPKASLSLAASEAADPISPLWVAPTDLQCHIRSFPRRKPRSTVGQRVSSCRLFSHECGHGRTRDAGVGAFDMRREEILFSSGDLQKSRIRTSKHVLWLL